MKHLGVQHLHCQPQENGEPAQVEGESTSSDEALHLTPPGPPATLVAKLSMEPSEEHGLWLPKSELPCKPEVLDEESWNQPHPTSYSSNAKSFRKHMPEGMQQESLQQKGLNSYSIGKESIGRITCGSLHSLLQQVELQHLSEIGLVHAELESHLKWRAELESHIEDLRRRVEDPECKQFLQQLLQQFWQVVDQDVKCNDRTAAIRKTVDVVEFSEDTRSHTEQRNSWTPPVTYTSTQTSSKSGNTQSFLLNDIKDQLSARSRFQPKDSEGLGSELHMLGKLSGVMEGGFSERVVGSYGLTEWAPRTRIKSLVEWGPFETICSVAIMLSAVLLGISTDLAARTRDPYTLPDFFLYADYTFTTWFLIELCLRMFADGILRFFLGPDWNWNIFDFGVVAVDLVSMALTLQTVEASQTSTGSSQHLSGMTRVARVSRLARSLRAIRLFRFLRELRKMVVSIMRSGLSLLYSMLLLTIIIFMFSVYLTQDVTFYLYDNKGESDSRIESLREYFGSLVYAGYILFQCITTGIDWGQVANALLQVHWSSSLALSFFMFFTVFAVLNMITGVFVDSALTSAQNEREEKINSIMEKEGEIVSQLQEFFGEADKDNSGAISLAELKEQMKKPMVRARLRTLEIDLSDARRVFSLLDIDKTGEVGIEEFIVGCLKMKGTAKSVDLITLMHEMRRMKDSMRTAFKDVNERFKQQHKMQVDLLQAMSNQSQIDQLVRANASWKSGAASFQRQDSSSSNATPKSKQVSWNAPASKPIQNGIERREGRISSWTSVSSLGSVGPKKHSITM